MHCCVTLYIRQGGIPCLGAYRKKCPLQIKDYILFQGQIQDLKSYLWFHVKSEHNSPITPEQNRCVGGVVFQAKSSYNLLNNALGRLQKFLTASSGIKYSLQSHALTLKSNIIYQLIRYCAGGIFRGLPLLTLFFKTKNLNPYYLYSDISPLIGIFGVERSEKCPHPSIAISISAQIIPSLYPCHHHNLHFNNTTQANITVAPPLYIQQHAFYYIYLL